MPARTVTLISPAVRQLLKQDGILRDLQSRGARIVAAAKASPAAVKNPDYAASIGMTSERTDRARVTVQTTYSGARQIEAKSGTLRRAISAGRD